MKINLTKTQRNAIIALVAVTAGFTAIGVGLNRSFAATNESTSTGTHQNVPVETGAATPNQTPATATAQLSLVEAQEIALDHAGVAASDATITKARLDTEDGVQVYEIDFVAAGIKYDYEVRASDGVILESEQESVQQDRSHGEARAQEQRVTESAQPATAAMSADEAKAIALQYAGVAESDTRWLKVEFEVDHGVAEYDIEFTAGGYEYDIEVRASDGVVTDFDRERD